MVTGLEASKGGPAREVHMKAGEEWTEAKYRQMNERYQAQTIEHLKKLARQDKPFFLQYWPLLPLTFPRHTVDRFTTPNGGTQTESMQELDGWIGDILATLEATGKADNTVVIIMGDNGNFTKYMPYSGYSPMIYRGGKGDATEGGVRVDAFIRWPGAIGANTYVGDMIHVVDLFTSIGRIAGATRHIPTDRIIDGVDQTAMMLLGETHGRRDHVFIYQGHKMSALVKEQYKLHIPAPGENFIVANFYDLFRDPREENPVSTPVGAWAAAPFKGIIQRHMMAKKKYPDTPPSFDRPYTGIENLRPESKAVVEAFMAWQPKKPK
jgi:arylsulfatase